jgi:hypothetical protein
VPHDRNRKANRKLAGASTEATACFAYNDPELVRSRSAKLAYGAGYEVRGLCLADTTLESETRSVEQSLWRAFSGIRLYSVVHRSA